MRELQNLIKETNARWEKHLWWKKPTKADALDFIATEVGEALEARLRMGSYIRNNPKKGGWKRVAEEVGDIIMMCLIALNVMGFDAEEIVLNKLREMDNFKGGWARDLLNKWRLDEEVYVPGFATPVNPTDYLVQGAKE